VFKRSIIQTVCTALALGGVLVGCGGVSQQPLAPGRAAPPTLSPSKALPRAAKAGVYIRTDRGWFYPDQDGSLALSFPPPPDNRTVRVEQATFTVAKGMVNQEVYITMKASTGSLLSDVVFDFSPDGLAFNPPLATLTVILSGPVNSQHLKAYHTDSTGKKTVVPLTVTPLGKNRWQVVIQVPGFSIYSLGDELIPEVLEP